MTLRANATHDMPGYEHGTLRGYYLHQQCGTRPCVPCLDANNHRFHAWRISTGRVKHLRLPIADVQRLLDGADPASVLAGLFGSDAVEALRERLSRKAVTAHA